MPAIRRRLPTPSIVIIPRAPRPVLRVRRRRLAVRVAEIAAGIATAYALAVVTGIVPWPL